MGAESEIHSTVIQTISIDVIHSVAFRSVENKPMKELMFLRLLITRQRTVGV